MNTPVATIDFESRSECDIKTSGSWRYSLDPTTEILCLAFRLPHWERGRTGLWHPAFSHLGIPDAMEDEDCVADVVELGAWVEDDGLVEAHNAFFERGIWTNILAPRYGFPAVDHRQWRCSAAKAASHALPRGLGDAASALLLSTRKDDEGHTLMLKVSKPRKPLKADLQAWLVAHDAGPCPQCKGKGTYKRKPCERCEGRGALQNPLSSVPPMPTLWHESREDFERLWAYCRQDVLAEAAVSEALPDLSPEETELYLLDQRINERGFQLDEDAVDAALYIIEVEAERLNDTLAVVTQGAVERGTQRDRLKNWLVTKGLVLEDTQAGTIANILDNDAEFLDPDALLALQILQDAGRASTGKYERMRAWKCPDGRVRGGLLYHGASTGRWSGAGVQPHNFVRGTVKISQDRLWECLKLVDLDAIRDLPDDKGTPIGSVMLALANALRGAICARDGCQLYVADYAAIEARVLLWLADDPHIELFRQGVDIYCDMASSIYERTITKEDKQERQLGKATILGCGYSMGPSKFVAAAANYGVTISEEFSERVVYTYRADYKCVVDLWYAQEEAAIEATRANGRVVECGRVKWYLEKGRERFLYAELPSGRRLAYPFPQVHGGMTRRGWRYHLTFMGVNPLNHQWERQRTYGGMIVENLVQAISRDIMADAMLRCEESGIYRPVLSVHDELISEADEGTGDLKEYEQLLATTPDWADECPIAAEGWVGTRYRK